jgi:tetratricopeptide (TPR) repeat protein
MTEPRFYSEPYRFTEECHNDWLQLAAESGIFAPLLPALLIGLALRRAEAPLAASLIALASNAIFHFPLEVPATAALFWLSLGLAGSGEEIEISVPRLPVTALGILFAISSAGLYTKQLYASSLLNRGMSLSLLGQPDLAEGLLKASASARPSDHRPLLRLGLNADLRGRDAEAAEYYQSTLNLQPELPEAWANLGLSLAKLNRLEEARRATEHGLSLNPASLEALGNLGKIAWLSGQAAQAEQIYLSGLERDPNWGQGHFNLAAIYMNLKKPKLARPHLEAALKLEPQNLQAAQLLKRLK